jgi:Beta-propeller repeat
MLSWCIARGRFMPVCKLKIIFVFVFSFLLVATGCGLGSSGVGGTGVIPATESVYVTQEMLFFGPSPASTILQFSTTANGDGPPASTLTGLDFVTFNGLAVDANGNIYVGGLTNNTATSGGQPEIFVYGPEESGTPTPKRTIIGPSTELDAFPSSPVISALALDNSGNIYVSAAELPVGSSQSYRSYAGIAIFSSTANGNAAPTRVIAGSATNIVGVQIAVDSAGNIYTTGGDGQEASILIFDSSANGNAPPTGTLAGSNTMIDDPTGVALDSAGNIYVSNLSLIDATSSILVFSAGSTGNVAPIRVISGSATTMGAIGNLCLDSAGNIYILNVINYLKFAPNATGNVAPIATITSPGFSEAFSIAVQ